MSKYYPAKIEKKWQKVWEKEKIYIAKDKTDKAKKYVLIEFPYPSGEGLHVGHLRPYVAGDLYSRYMRMKGFETMYPMGWDAFGLPTENFAIKKGIHPSITTAKNIKNAKRQVRNWGIGFDWSREINTTDPAYYKWTQWIFLQLFKTGLAYEATGGINWCPACKTGLANEEVVDDRCERCGTKVEKKELRQWYLKITAYAEKLLEGLKNLAWPEQIKIQQENWIGKSVGALLKFQITKLKYQIEVFTTRPDTLYGATYLVLAPEHELIQKMEPKITNQAEVITYTKEARNKTDVQRTAAEKEKTGVELKGIKAINPATGQEIPLWVADYVLAGYGTGAVMAVPAHDERDFEFAKKLGLAMVEVIKPESPPEIPGCWTGEGILINSGKFDGWSSMEARNKITESVGGKVTVQYRLRDWVFSRQRYWGEPIPLIHCERCGVVAVPEKDLPVKLPKVEKYEPTGTGESPLAIIDEWVRVKCPSCGGPGKRETNTMPQWAGSSWYYLRYTDPKNKKELASRKLLERWLPVDVYFGGMEHTTLHLLYSRFWHLFLYDQKLVPTPEPYVKRVPHGMVLAADGEKMSKSRGNVINPDEIVKKYGADVLRIYEMFLGPHEATISWNAQGAVGVKRFLDRVWKLAGETAKSKSKTTDLEIEKQIHRGVKKIEKDIESYKFNTAISNLMILCHSLAGGVLTVGQLETFLKLLAPFAPHLTEEIWRAVLKNKKSIHGQGWPEYNPRYLQEENVKLIVQVNGKMREILEVRRDLSEAQARELVLASEKVKKCLGGQAIKKFIYLPNRLVNIVV